MEEPNLPPSKKARLSETPARERSDRRSPPVLASLHRSITPPSPVSRGKQGSASLTTNTEHSPENEQQLRQDKKNSRIISSPFQLTHIRDLPDSSGNNVDAVRLRDILGDPLIRECWQFNYLFDVDFLMHQFDEDVRSLVNVKVVHGSWKREAPNRVRIEVCLSPPLSGLLLGLETVQAMLMDT